MKGGANEERDRAHPDRGRELHQFGIMVAAKINALKFAKATGEIPENINFAIKPGALRDFLDNSVVPYQTSDARADLRTADIAKNVRDFTLLISCMAASEQSKN